MSNRVFCVSGPGSSGRRPFVAARPGPIRARVCLSHLPAHDRQVFRPVPIVPVVVHVGAQVEHYYFVIFNDGEGYVKVNAAWLLAGGSSI